MTHHFEACAAPLGVATGDGRRLGTGPWRLRQPAVALCTMPPDRRVVGEVTELSIAPAHLHFDPPALMLYGAVTDDDVAADIRAGRLFPQLDLDADEGHYEDHDDDLLPHMLVMGSGWVRALTLGTTPAWPQVWIRLVPAALTAAVP